MPEQPKIKVQIEWGDIKHTAEGDLETVVREVMQFAAKVLPNYSLASKLTFSPDYSSMVDDLSSAVQLTPEGEAVLLKPEMSAENSIAMVLLAARVAHAVGTRPNVQMDPDTLAMMTKTGLIDRTSDGAYKLSMQGIRKAHEIAKGLTARAASSPAQKTVTASG